MIGIITPYKVNNYGTKLQAYAMQCLMSKYDDAELLGFVPASDSRITSVLGKVYLKAKLKLSGKKPAKTPEMQKRDKAINSFDSHYKFGRKFKGNSEWKKEIKKYNAVVCGSDQLWAPSNVIADYFTLTLVPDEINKFSYAASFGINSVPSSMRRRYKKFLSRLNSISVREEQGKNIVKDVAGLDAQVVLDPTLMIGKEQWAKLADESKIKIDSPYVFCYFLGTNPEHRNFAKKLAEEKGLKLVTIPHFKEFNEADKDFGDIPLYEADPADFLSLIANAAYVCTDSFHGTVFSVIFNRQVAVFERFQNKSAESTNSRIYTLLENLGMTSQLFKSKDQKDDFVNNEIDYNEVNSRFEELKKDSFGYLDKAIGHERR